MRFSTESTVTRKQSFTISRAPFSTFARIFHEFMVYRPGAHTIPHRRSDEMRIRLKPPIDATVLFTCPEYHPARRSCAFRRC
jgi:hypothetical protein